MRSLVLLCVDDSPQLLQVRKAYFEHLGFSVVTATSVATALAVLEKMAIDAVLMDYKPEGMDSEAVAFHIKNRSPQQPIILLSASSEMPQRILWLLDEYVMRGEPPERIVQVIDKLTRSRARMASAEDVKHHRTAAQHRALPCPMQLRFAHEFPNWKASDICHDFWGKYPGATESARATPLVTAWACQLFLGKTESAAGGIAQSDRSDRRTRLRTQR